jgi:hypothetical protein
MKKLVLIPLISFLVFRSFSQKLDERLSSSYSSEELSLIAESQPELINLLNYAVDHACYITTAPTGKSVNGLETIQLNSKETPSFTSLQKKIEKQNQYFLISGTNNMLVIKSEWVLKNEMENQH